MSPSQPKDRGKSGKKPRNIDIRDFRSTQDLGENRNSSQNKYFLRSCTSNSDSHDVQFPHLIPPKPPLTTTSVHPTESSDFAVAGGSSESQHSSVDETIALANYAGQGDGSNSKPQPSGPRSFASFFKDATNIKKSGTLRFIAPMVTDLGTKKAVIPVSLIASEAENWCNTLVGYFVGKRPAFPFVKFHANRLWKQFELDDVVLNNQGYFFFKFKSEHGLLHVLENGPWLFNDYPVLLQRWQPGVWFEKPNPTKVHLWVNIYDLPIDLWNFEILSRIVSVIGVPIAADRYTTEMCDKKKGTTIFARILVEICADQEIPTFAEAEIMGIDRRFRLQYLWTPPRCSHCKIFGHNFDICSVRPKTDVELEVDSAGTKVGSSEAPRAPGTQEHDGFQVPKRRKRGPKKAIPQNDKRKDAISNTIAEVSIPTAPDEDAIHDPDFVDKPDHAVGVDSDPVLDPTMESTVASPGTPPVLEDLCNPNHVTDYISSWLDYIGPSTNEELDSEKIWNYRDPTGKSHGPFSIAQLHNSSEYLPSDLNIWKIADTENNSIQLHSALKRRVAGRKNSNAD